jgi:hypothetical protein
MLSIPRRVAFAVLLALLVTQPQAGSPPLEVTDFEQVPEPYRSSDESGQFQVSLSVEPLAGQTLVAEPFTVTLGVAIVPPADIFRDGYESP